MGRRTGWLLAAAALLAAGSPAAAQERAADRFGPPARTTLTLFGAVLTPLNNITADASSFGTAVSSSGAVGGDATFWFGTGHLGLGFQGAYAPADLEVKPTEFQGAVPSDLGGADYVAATATLMYRLLPAGAAAAVEPYFGLGGGVRRLSVQAIASPEVEDVTDPVGSVAAGAKVWFSRRFAIHFEVRDIVSSFEAPTTGASRLQNDVLISVGLGTRLR
ncbi:MAG: hypothetical protein ACE5HP_03395 [Gemmatimonadota bacterium]